MKVWIMCCLNLGSMLNIFKILLDFCTLLKILNKIFKIAQKRMREYKKKCVVNNALPPGVDECQVHVESSLCGQFQFPENTHCKKVWLL